MSKNIDKERKTLSSDELWKKAAQGGPINREELGIGENTPSNLNQGFQREQYKLLCDTKHKRIKILIRRFIHRFGKK